MLTAEIVMLPDSTLSGEVELYFNREGFDYLMGRLDHIRDGKTDHLHLMSRSWGLGDLDEKSHKPTNQIAHHLRLTLIAEPELS